MKGLMLDVENSFKDNPTLASQVERHPWLVMGGSATAGIIAGSLIGRLSTLLPHSTPARPVGGNGSHARGGTSLLVSLLLDLLEPVLKKAMVIAQEAIGGDHPQPDASPPPHRSGTSPST